MNLGQATLSLWGHYLPSQGRIRTQWDRVQEAIAWRTVRWHFRRFAQRIEKHVANHWHCYDAIYVHCDVLLAEAVAKYRPTILRLSGPVSPERASVLQKLDAVCANGDALIQLRTILGTKAVELPIGLNTTIFTPTGPSVRSALGWSDRDKIVGYVGRLTHLKGVTLLASAFRKAVREIPGLKLLIVGHGEDEKALRTMLATEASLGQVHIEPDVASEQLPMWYRAMNLIVMPSRYENFSNAILEAMGCGVPILASEVGGNPLVTQSGAGSLFRSESVNSLHASLTRAFAEPGVLRVRGKQGAEYVHGRFSWTVSAECLEGIIEARLGLGSARASDYYHEVKSLPPSARRDSNNSLTV
ncbi:MAG: glycosyltransferase family 4 protein [Candidatus Binatia bacterium]